MERTITKELLKIGAVFLRPEDPFTWASGIKSPIYCDNRLILSEPKTRDIVEKAIGDTVLKEYPEAQILMGTSTAGIAHAAIAAHLIDLPMGYVRGKSKGHGRTNIIEGKLKRSQKVVVIEDLISTAGSAIDTVAVLKEAGAEVLGILSIFTYNMKKSLDNLKAFEIKNVSLSNLDVLVDVACEEGYITSSDKSKLLLFRDNPQDESWMKG